jgi:TolB protein
MQTKEHSAQDELKLKEIPFKIVYESYHKNNWELYLINADGSNPVNLTRTSRVDEMYPHVSSDGSKICFVADEKVAGRKIRNVYYMNIDGTDRVRVAYNARQPCWSPNGKAIAYLKGEYTRYSDRPYATSELFIYDLETGKRREHPNKKLHHLFNICWSPDGKWFVASVEGGMGYSQAILAFEAKGNRIVNLTEYGLKGCRPEFSADGKKIGWGLTDWDLCIGDIDLKSSLLEVSGIRKIVTCPYESKVYHIDFSPDGKYIAFSYGPFSGGQQVGGKARGWNICVGDMTGKWVKITTDGNHNKEPDWVPIPTVSR